MTAHVLLNNVAYLSKCQVDTPSEVVEWAWEVIGAKRNFINNVVDLGAGDGRFSLHGAFDSYTGIEIDISRVRSPNSLLPPHAELLEGCALEAENSKYDLCVGNPPYVRHHDINTEWQKKVATDLEIETGQRIDLRSNAFVLFLYKALLATKPNGLVSQIIPFEWVSRPATSRLRSYIQDHRWTVDVYRFVDPIFSRVLTTACLTVIDKSKNSGTWSYYKVNHKFEVSESKQPTGSKRKVASYVARSDHNYALRGLSPGGQKVFCLTEGERLHYGLKIDQDVVPCVTSFRHIPPNETTLSKRNFEKYYIDSGQRCWLIKSDVVPLSSELLAYLDVVPTALRNNATCNLRPIWWEYKAHPAPQILYGSGFTKKGPKFLTNPISAVAVGSVQGIHRIKGIGKTKLAKKLREFNFNERVVSHANKLRKIEVNQMNGIVQEIING